MEIRLIFFKEIVGLISLKMERSTAFRKFSDYAGRDCFPGAPGLLAMTYAGRPCHCERSEAIYSHTIYEMG